MTCTSVDISIVVPHRDSISTLSRLLESIPNDYRIEIIVVDNSLLPIKKSEVVSNREFYLYYSDYKKFAGGARNVGIKQARGKWLLFADADDYYTPQAFDLFLSLINSNADIIYTCMTGWNDVTNEYCNRGEIYTNLIRRYLSGNISEKEIRYMFHSPCCKMIKKALIERFNLCFSEVRSGEDALFSVMSGHFAKEIIAIDKTTYVATLSGNNIPRQIDYESVRCRYIEDLKINRFLRRKGQWRWQLPIFDTIRYYRGRKRFQLLKLAFRYGQPLLSDFYTHVRY